MISNIKKRLGKHTPLILLFSLSVVLLLFHNLTLARAEAGSPVKASTPVYFYIEFHTEAIIRNKEKFDIETELLKRLATILEKHKAKGSFMFLDIYPRMIKQYNPGSHNMITLLESHGHEIGVHYHPWGPPAITIASTIRAIKDAGAKSVTSLTTSFHVEPVLDMERVSYDRGKKLSQLRTMINDMYTSSITSAFRWCMGDSTPFRPQRDNWITSGWTDCKNETRIQDPNGRIVAVGMYEGGGYTFYEKDGSFKTILSQIDTVLHNINKKKINYYPLAIHDYYFLNPSGGESYNRVVAINEERLNEFDKFLDIIDDYVRQGYLTYATRRDVTNAYRNWEEKADNPNTSQYADPRLNLFYMIHVHSGGENLPEFLPLSREDFDGTAKAIETIARTLESHNAKGIFHIMQNFADAVLRYQGVNNNILRNLQSRGHEIGAHVHTDLFNQWEKTRNSIMAAGIENVYSISGIKRVSVPTPDAFKIIAQIGFKVVIGNNSPLDPFPMEGLRGATAWGFIGNENYKMTGAFIHPWRPDYENNNLSKHNPRGQVLYVDIVPPLIWFSGIKPINAASFDRLRHYFEAAITNLDKDQINAWGLVTHEAEYQMMDGRFRPTNAVDMESIRALDDFLAYIDRYRNNIRWATTKNIYMEFEEWEKKIK